MKIVSAIIMLIGLIIGFLILLNAESAPQEAISLVPIIGAYVLGRALENFVNKDEEIVILLRKLIKDKPSEKSTKLSKEINSDSKVESKEISISDEADNFYKIENRISNLFNPKKKN